MKLNRQQIQERAIYVTRRGRGGGTRPRRIFVPLRLEWMAGRQRQGTPRILHPLASCLDFSVAKSGFLAAYRWSGESKLLQEDLISVRDEAA